MKMTANLPRTQVLEEKKSAGKTDRITKIITTKWRLNSIYETGLITDEANFDNVDVVFSQFYIYALFGNRVDKFRYKFVSQNLFTVNIEGVDVKCRIKEFSDDAFIFHVDFKNSYFIVELASA